jgi:hypothetical protein
LNYRRWIIVGYVLALMALTASVLLIPGQKYDTLTTSDSGWVYDTAVEIDRTNALAENNPLSHAPYGLPISPGEQVQPLLSVMLYRGVKALNPSVTLMDVVKYWAPLVFALSLIPIFLLGRELRGEIGGAAAAFFAATMVSTIYWNKVGAFDREPIQLILGAWAMYLTIKLFKVPRSSVPKFALLAGLVYGLFGLAWAGWWYIIPILLLTFIFVIITEELRWFPLLLIIGVTFAILGGGRWWGPVSLFAAIMGAFVVSVVAELLSRKVSVESLLAKILAQFGKRGDLVGGFLLVVVVITLGLWLIGGQSPLFWGGIFQTMLGYVGIGGGGGISFSAYATEMQAPSSWGDTLGKFYGADILTWFILILVIAAFLGFCLSRKRWELLIISWLIVLAAMVWPGAGQVRFERLWWPFVPVLAGVGTVTVISFLRRISVETYGEQLKHLQNPIALLLVAGVVAAPFAVNAYTNAYQTVPPTEWHGFRGLDEGFMEAFDWLRENTPENSVVSIQWSFGHLLTGAAQRATVCDGAEIRAEEGTWENDPSFVPRPPDYIYRVEGNYAYIYGMDIPRRPFEINGRRIDVQWFPLIGENEFEWYIKTYRDNYGVKIDYVVFSYDEFYQSYGYYFSTQPRNILLSAERLFTPSQLFPTVEGSEYTFNFGENRRKVVFNLTTQGVYLKTDNENLNLDGCGLLRVNENGEITDFINFFPPSTTPDIQETLIIFLDGNGNVVSAWLVGGVSRVIEERPVPMGMRVFRDNIQDIDYLRVAFTSSNGLVKVLELDHSRLR